MQSYNIGCDFSPDGKLLYSGSAEGQLVAYDYRLGKLVKRLILGKTEVCLDVACHPVLPSTVACGTWGGSIVVWQ